MVKKVTVRQTGTSVSATIPKEMADRLHTGVGDELFAIETENGVLLTPYDPTFEQGMKAYNRIAKKHRAALRKLAR
jgi:antitoxin MazE